MRNKGFLGLWAAAILASAAGVRATEITGSYNNRFPDGYDASSGSYDVPADVGGVPSATFNDNGNDGLGVGGAGTSLTVEGGEFDGNFNFGIEIASGATATVSGGVFDENTASVASQDSSDFLTIFGGQFLGSGYSVYDGDGAIAIYGGKFSTAYTFDVLGGTVQIYGAFAGVADGQTVILPYATSTAGSFYGKLEDNSAVQAYTYFADGGTVTLHGIGTLIPEPESLDLVAVVGTKLLVRRRRTL